jgi:hypothetical protein
MNRKSDDPIALQVRMTEGLRQKLAKAAEENGRSLNAEILWRLEQSLPKPKPYANLGLLPLKAQVKEVVEEILDQRGIGRKKGER